MKTLLAIIYEPSLAENFIRYAVHLSGRFNLNLQFLYILSYEAHPPPGLSAGLSGSFAYELDRDLAKEQERALDTLKKSVEPLVSRMPDPVEAGYSVEFGHAKAVIAGHVAKHPDPALLLEGKHKGSLLSLNPSNIEVVRQVDCPVWVIPTDVEFQEFKKVLYASDFHEADIQALQELSGLLETRTPEIQTFHVTEVSDFDALLRAKGLESLIREQVSYPKLSFSLVESRKDDVADAICHFAEEQQAQLIVLLKEQYGLFEGLINPSATRKIIRRARLPVLIFHQK